MTGSIRLPIADIAIEEVECRPSRQFRIAGELILSAIVVRAPADNGDGVLAGALGDLTEKVVALLLTAAHTKQSSRWQKKPRQCHRGQVGARKPIRTSEYDGARIVRGPIVP